ncbi:hypothetical protein LUX12_00915 [Streptomyces somaliensis]|uniref:hypothetical protein n=1 Tax=Streptomyces somaliensis TaxID=78355 RepID=UPI0020CCD51B|nr:hypothetical protein [Streptomyces somaliensis]MCP9943685.1 hypothetical protein [Streptomyces somaliensis]MCP9963068.1 hypothetical protein [Streptomyces somaliensis]
MTARAVEQHGVLGAAADLQQHHRHPHRRRPHHRIRPLHEAACEPVPDLRLDYARPGAVDADRECSMIGGSDDQGDA